MISGLLVVSFVWLAICAVIFGGLYRKMLCALWYEPMLRFPVLIFESDDWGPGKVLQAQQLKRLVSILSTYRDNQGRHPIMTLGLVLALPDTERIRVDELKAYHRVDLAEPQFKEIREAMLAGVAARVFALQLHGLEHYWPAAVLAAANQNEEVRDWLTGDILPNTECLPAALQSRWINGAHLPSYPLDAEEARVAAREEVEKFTSIFGYIPTVVVPPTFVWSSTVERGWAASGVRIVVTPGQRYDARDAFNKLCPSGPAIRNGDKSSTGMIYVVRNDYFEPAYGHKAGRVLHALERKTRTGRPVLLEMHRFNFMGNTADAERALSELNSALSRALNRYPDLVFLSTEAVAETFTMSDSQLIEHRYARRMHIWLQRWQEVSRLWAWAKLTGIALVVILLQFTIKRGGYAVRSGIAEHQ